MKGVYQSRECTDATKGPLQVEKNLAFGFGRLEAALLVVIEDGIDEPQAVVDAIFDYYEKRGFQPSEAEREILLNL